MLDWVGINVMQASVSMTLLDVQLYTLIRTILVQNWRTCWDLLAVSKKRNE